MTTTDTKSHRLVEVLLVLSRRSSASVEEICAETGIPSSAVYRHLGTLIDAGLAAHSRVRGRFCAGARTVPLAEHYRRDVFGSQPATGVLSQLSANTAELAAYMVADGDRVVCVAAVDGPQVVRCCFAPGLSQPLLRGASATALLSGLPDRQITALAAGFALSSLETDELYSTVQTARRQGFATSSGALEEGVWGVRVPVFDSRNELVGAVSTMAPLFRVDRDKDRLVTLTLAAAHEIGRVRNR